MPLSLTRLKSAGLTFAFVYAASETLFLINIVREFYEFVEITLLHQPNRVCLYRVSDFLYLLKIFLWERDSAPMGVAPEIVIYCLQ